MHFFWGGDMPRYSPPLPFRRGRAGCPCVLACPRGRPARVSRMCALAGVPRPARRVAAAYVRAGRRARARAWLGGARACWPARAGAGFVDVLAGWRARGLVRALTPHWLQQSRASRQPVLPF